MRTSFINFPPRHGIVVEMRYERKVHGSLWCFLRRASFSWNIKMNDEEEKKEREEKKEEREAEKKGGGKGSNGSDYVKIHRRLKNDEQWFILSVYSNPLRFLWWEGNILTWIYPFVRQHLLPFSGMDVWRLV